MPPLTEDEHSALKADITANGVLVPITVDQHGVIVDGHHRQHIADQLGIPCPEVVREFATDDERRDVALGLNLKRRHLTREQMRQLIATECERPPTPATAKSPAGLVAALPRLAWYADQCPSWTPRRCLARPLRR
jgi:hypothetical protein